MAKCVCPQCGHEFSPVKASPAAAEDLTRTLKPPKARGAYSARFTAIWADGTETSQTVICASVKDRWPAAFQACDRLRRLRAVPRHTQKQTRVDLNGNKTLIKRVIRDAPMVDGMCGVRMIDPQWWAAWFRRPMPALTQLVCVDTGETFEPLAHA